MVSGSLPAGCTFERYLENYYEPKAPDRFVREVIAGAFPSEVKICNPADLLDREIPDEQHRRLTASLIERQAGRPRTAYRTEEETRELAKTDASLYLTAYYLNDARESSLERVLGGSCYLVTNSSAYARAAREIGIVEQFAARPAALLAIQHVIGDFARSSRR